MDASLRFWAKTYGAREPACNESVESFKPVLHHMLDVAAVAWSFLRRQEARLVREAALIAMAPEDYADLVFGRSP
jgi:HD domain